VSDINSNLGAGLSTANGHWSGNAADGFHNYMNEWTAALNEDQDACFTIRDQLTNLAQQAKDLRRAAPLGRDRRTTTRTSRGRPG
jgi:uncharacterized protein YukE